jgi:hypothetical protein
MKFQNHPLEDLKTSLSAQQNHETDRSGASLSGQVAEIANSLSRLVENSEGSATKELNDALSEKRMRRAN